MPKIKRTTAPTRTNGDITPSTIAIKHIRTPSEQAQLHIDLQHSQGSIKQRLYQELIINKNFPEFNRFDRQQLQKYHLCRKLTTAHKLLGQINSELNDHDNITMAIYNNKQFIGAGLFSVDPTKKVLQIYYLVILPQCWRSQLQYGSKLYQHIEGLAKLLKVTCLKVESTRMAMGFYRKHGFKALAYDSNESDSDESDSDESDYECTVKSDNTCRFDYKKDPYGKVDMLDKTLN